MRGKTTIHYGGGSIDDTTPTHLIEVTIEASGYQWSACGLPHLLYMGDDGLHLCCFHTASATGPDPRGPNTAGDGNASQEVCTARVRPTTSPFLKSCPRRSAL